MLLCLGYISGLDHLWCAFERKQYSYLYGPDSMDNVASHLMCKTCSSNTGVATKINPESCERFRFENRIAHPSDSMLAQPFTAVLRVSQNY